MFLRVYNNKSHKIIAVLFFFFNFQLGPLILFSSVLMYVRFENKLVVKQLSSTVQLLLFPNPSPFSLSLFLSLSLLEVDPHRDGDARQGGRSDVEGHAIFHELAERLLQVGPQSLLQHRWTYFTTNKHIYIKMS